MKCNDEGIALIKRFEGFEPVCYADIVGVPTIGYGHTSGLKKSDVGKLKITEDQADEYLKEDLSWAEDCISYHVLTNLNSNQFSALCSFVFNVGCKAFMDSTLLARLNKGQYDDVPVQLLRWNKAGGRVIKGLINRRIAESEFWKKS